MTNVTQQNITGESIDPFKHQISMAGPLHLQDPLLYLLLLACGKEA